MGYEFKITFVVITLLVQSLPNISIKLVKFPLSICISGFKPSSHWSIPSSSKKFGAPNEEYWNPNQRHSEILENENIVYNDGLTATSKKLRTGCGFSNGVGSNTSIDLEWETAEGKSYITITTVVLTCKTMFLAEVT